MKRGFTLIELLVAVLIIGVLTAMALPMYQKSVDKSRYATLMPLAKNIKDAQEAFYLGGGKYSKDLGSLDVRVPGNPSGATATLSDGTTVEISTTDGYGYVKLSKNNLNNNYIIYQDRSANYPGEIHCEALTDNSRAEELCQNLGGQKISGSLTEGYTTYILSGTGAGVSPDLNQEAENHGNWQGCDTYPCTKPCTSTIGAGYTCMGTYYEDGKYSERVCKDGVCIHMGYDEAGIKTTRSVCVEDANGVCNVQQEITYNANGDTTRTRFCGSWDTDGTCTAYSAGTDYKYDTHGNVTAERSCGSFEGTTCLAYNGGVDYAYEYDENGHQIAKDRRICGGGNIDSNGDCTKYVFGNEYTYDSYGNETLYRYCSNYEGTTCIFSSTTIATYDANGNMLSKRVCKSYDSTGTCTSYEGSATDATYDSNGNQTSYYGCSQVDNNGTCTAYNFSRDSTYDANGNPISTHYCSRYEGSTCTAYSDSGYTYTYDENGHKIASSDFTCSTYDDSGACIAYSGGNDYTYDTNGNTLSYHECNTREGTTCTEYRSGQYKTYDTHGNVTSERYCRSYAGTTCTDYRSGADYTYQYDQNGNKLVSYRACSSIDDKGACTSYYGGAEETLDSYGNRISYFECSGIDSNGRCSGYEEGYERVYDQQGQQVGERWCSGWSGTECTSWTDWSISS